MSQTAQPGDLVLIELPQSDGAKKLRPALVLATTPPFDDLLVCGVSTQLHHEVKGFDDLITATDDDFAASGLKMTSLIRLGFVASLPTGESRRILGKVSSARLVRLRSRLAKLLTD